jgi:hypothetical protein
MIAGTSDLVSFVLRLVLRCVIDIQNPSSVSDLSFTLRNKNNVRLIYLNIK